MKAPLTAVFGALLLFSRMAFSQAPDEAFIRKNAIRIEDRKDLPKALLPILKGKTAILFGEIHGTREAPEMVLGTLRRLFLAGKKPLLGLEIPEEEQALVDRFLETGESEVFEKDSHRFFRAKYQDGRATRALFELLSAVREIEGVSVVCFDPKDRSDGQSRDTGMAKRLAETFAKSKADVLVVLAGNIHSAMEKGTAWDPSYRPMGLELVEKHGMLFPRETVLPISIRMKQGEAWVCYTAKASECGPKKTGRSDVFSDAVDWESYFLKYPGFHKGYGATVFIRTVSYSPPYLPQKEAAPESGSSGQPQEGP